MSSPVSDPQYGMALSGGGFRAALFHLGVIRFLRDAGLLRRVSKITSVSGGSIIGAHVVLNWERYCGTEQEFDQVAQELIRLVRLDVRNRIVRRFPLMAGVNLMHRLALRGSARRFTRAGLLEREYEEFLYGDTGLLQLPETPRLYILATNLSEGALCAFSREGLILQRRAGSPGALQMETVEMGLATVAMAVAASSAFPGFFPPLELNSRDVGAAEAEFSRHAFTDGGIYDNLGLRMFRYLCGLDLPVAEPEGRVDGIEPERLDGVFVSDAGASFKVTADARGGGLLRTALRSTDILMDRVNQMELEAFAGTPGAVFCPITRIVEPSEDPTAIHPIVQRQAALIRTDLDRFSDLEISALVQHGYGVARRVLMEAPDAPSVASVDGPPWDPLSSLESQQPAVGALLNDPAHAIRKARELQRSSVRRMVTNLFSARDWPTYVWLPLIAVILFAVPAALYRAHVTTVKQEQVLAAVAKSSPLYRDVLDLLQSERPYDVAPITFEEVAAVEPLDFTGYEVISDDRIYDLRGWTDSKAPAYAARMHARFQILRNRQAAERPTLRIQLPSEQGSMRVEYLPAALDPKHERVHTAEGTYLFQTSLDFAHVPVGDEVTLVVRQVMPEVMAAQRFGLGRFKFTVAADTGLVRIWVLLPRGRPHSQFELYRFPIGRPDEIEIVHATTSVEVPSGAIATFELINPPNGYRYECRWRWLGEAGEPGTD